MKKHNKRFLIAFVASLVLIVLDVMLVILFFRARYLPFLLAAEMLLLPALLNLALLCFGRDVRVPAKLPVPEPILPPPEEVVEESGESPAKKKKAKRPHRTPRQLLNACLRGIAIFYNRVRPKLLLLLIPVLILLAHVLVWTMLKRTTSIYSFTYLEPLLLVLSFILCLALGKWCSYAREGGEDASARILDNLATAFAMEKLTMLLLALATLVRLLANYDAQKIAVWVVAGLLCYETVFIVISFAVKLIRREFDNDPDLGVPLPFSGQTKDMGILSYLERNTGITMRSLWSIRLIKHILPYMLMAGVAIFWLATGVVQIESHQKGAHYRMGELQEEVLEPGIHFTLPWPFDRVEIYNTESINKVTIGYTSTQNTDNTWTGNHGNSEYKLLMGSGDELCSINLRIEYRISDLNEYVRTSASPDKLMEAKAYELVTERTISTDLNSLLSVDREAFAEDFKAELIREVNAYKVGIEIVSVVLESIHPPVEVALVYQQTIGAEIDAQKQIYDAQGIAAVTLEEAKQNAYTAEQKALAAKYEAVAAARADVAEFMASVEADRVDSEAYRYYKYLTAISKAYGNARLVIVGEGVDTSNIYFGNITPQLQ